MQDYEIVFAKSVVKDLQKIPSEYAEKILAKIELLTDNSFPHGYKKLKGFQNLYRIRVGDYRIVYAIYHRKRIIDITVIRHRKDVYE